MCYTQYCEMIILLSMKQKQIILSKEGSITYKHIFASEDTVMSTSPITQCGAELSRGVGTPKRELNPIGMPPVTWKTLN